MFQEINAQMSELPTVVQIWTNWMMMIFMGSLFFVKKHHEARWSLAAFAATMALAMGTFAIWKNVHLFAAAHIVFWVPLLVYLLRCRLHDQRNEIKRPKLFQIWAAGLMATIAVSLIFDARDVYLVIIGVK